MEKKAKTFDIETMISLAKEKNLSSGKRLYEESFKKLEIDVSKEIDKEQESSDDTDSETEVEIPETKSNIEVPKSRHISLEHSYKTITALAIDQNGHRLISGCMGYEIKLWDFHGMDSELQPFRVFDEMVGNNQITSLSFNCRGEQVLITSGSSQPKIIDREGHAIKTCIKGDQYIVDTINTLGHIAFVNEGCWHPRNRDEFMTCSNDGTVRTWNVETCDKKYHEIIKIKGKNGSRVIPTGCAYDGSGNLLTAYSSDGSLQIWDRRKKLVNAIFVVRNGHELGSEGTLTYAYDNMCIATRTTDGTLKLWDIRTLSGHNSNSSSQTSSSNNNNSRDYRHNKSIKEWHGLYNRYAMTNCVFSPNDRLICTPTSQNIKANISGKLVFMDRLTGTPDNSIINKNNAIKKATKNNENNIKNDNGNKNLDILQEIALTPLDSQINPENQKNKFTNEKYEENEVVGGVRVLWHPKLNQIALGQTDGVVQVYFDNKISHNGALLCADVHRVRRQDVFTDEKPYAFNPDMLPDYDDHDADELVELEKQSRTMNQRSYKPEMPVTGPGIGGRIAPMGGTLHSFIIKNLALAKPVDDKQNPREALLKHAKAASENPYWTKAYQKNQPKPVFDENANIDDIIIPLHTKEDHPKRLRYN